jgi:hypothetical protein
MEKEEEIQALFNLCELCSQLSALLWHRYFDQFNQIMYDLEKQRGMEKHFPFKY